LEVSEKATAALRCTRCATSLDEGKKHRSDAWQLTDRRLTTPTGHGAYPGPRPRVGAGGDIETSTTRIGRYRSAPSGRDSNPLIFDERHYRRDLGGYEWMDDSVVH